MLVLSPRHDASNPFRPFFIIYSSRNFIEKICRHHYCKFVLTRSLLIGSMTAGKSVLITFSEPRVVIRHSQAVLQLLSRVLLKQAALGSQFTSTNQKFLDFLVHSSTQSRSEHYRRNLARVQFIESFARVFSNLSMLRPISSR